MFSMVIFSSFLSCVVSGGLVYFQTLKNPPSCGPWVIFRYSPVEVVRKVENLLKELEVDFVGERMDGLIP